MSVFGRGNKHQKRGQPGNPGQFARDTRGATAPGTGGPSSVDARNGAAATGAAAQQSAPGPGISHALQRFAEHHNTTPKPKTAAAPAAPPDSPYPPKPGDPGDPGVPGKNETDGGWADTNRRNTFNPATDLTEQEFADLQHIIDSNERDAASRDDNVLRKIRQLRVDLDTQPHQADTDLLRRIVASDMLIHSDQPASREYHRSRNIYEKLPPRGGNPHALK